MTLIAITGVIHGLDLVMNEQFIQLGHTVLGSCGKASSEVWAAYNFTAVNVSNEQQVQNNPASS